MTDLGPCRGLVGRGLTIRSCDRPAVEDPTGHGDPFWAKCAEHQRLYRCDVCRSLGEPGWEWKFSDVLACPACHRSGVGPLLASAGEYRCEPCGGYLIEPVGLCWDHETQIVCQWVGCPTTTKPGRVLGWVGDRDPDGTLSGLRSRPGGPRRFCVVHTEIERLAGVKLEKEYRKVQRSREGWTSEQWAAHREAVRSPVQDRPEPEPGQLTML